jgi:hypothetical protein
MRQTIFNSGRLIGVLGMLYDIHGNVDALEAVLGDAEAVGVDRWLLGGDYGPPSYDVERAAAAYRTMGGNFGEFPARRIEKGSD